MLTQYWSEYMTALSFMTRLGSARMCSSEEIAATMRQFYAVGLTIGALITFPFALGIFSQHPWIQAWLWVFLSIWITRALHWDGWADIWDGWGSCARGERFWQIVKDSRVGAFGAIAMVIGILGQTLLAHELFLLGEWQVLIFAPVAGRVASVIIGGLGDAPEESVQGRLFLQGATRATILIQTALAIVTGFLLCGFLPTIYTVILSAGMLWAYLRLASIQGGINGDFLGATIIGGELIAMLAYLI
ncbi:adenosylcobinamide-GDP ribazoletransferase [Halodesulfovibrio marinisediminis]|uniref:Adenosylcobinamide-GDP ribazoletransferase n=1 Tax=Halodesulfovibrio marinisediminis DSM 17456 TaxID=1121457 RepID=A0A1N6G0T7_9BACT|nr:adenosylcobinamide-GDP ribazoletransferase [Halodesulfovibrio marinisediminis]SIO01123.1 cobalamin-5'-phosphate synthase [Halodesulfovibrio marinisediminis DSM 17456]